MVRRALLLVACALVLTGCSGADPRATTEVRWSQEPLPTGFTPSLLTPYDDGLLVASDGSADGKQPPRLLELDGSRALPVHPTTYYGARAVWRVLTTRGDEVYALGGRSGGAHGNIRWSAWAGSVTDLFEESQLFETFGGPDAGGLVALVVPASGEPVAVGSRVAPDHSGLDIAVWDLVGHRWERRPSVGTALAADSTQQPTVQGATRRRDGVLITGAITKLVDGTPHLVPAAWTSRSFTGPWERTELPAGTAGVAAAQSATCATDGRCLVVGYDGDRVAAWELGDAGSVVRVRLPRAAAGPTAQVLAPVGTPGSFAVVVAGASPRSTLLVQTGGTWSKLPGPRGTVLDLAQVGQTWWVSTSAGLWSARVPG